MNNHPDIVVEKKSDSPDEDKSVHDSKLLIPTLRDFFLKHPLINPQTFLGDSAFDTAQLYKDLFSSDTFGKDKHFSKAYIPLNIRSHLENMDYTINEDGIPCCPHDANLAMKPEGTKRRGTDIKAFKFVCPKVKWIYDRSTQNNIVNVNVKIPVLLPNVGEWFTSIPKRIFVPIPVYSVVRMSGTKPTKSERL